MEYNTIYIFPENNRRWEYFIICLLQAINSTIDLELQANDVESKSRIGEDNFIHQPPHLSPFLPAHRPTVIWPKTVRMHVVHHPLEVRDSRVMSSCLLDEVHLITIHGDVGSQIPVARASVHRRFPGKGLEFLYKRLEFTDALVHRSFCYLLQFGLSPRWQRRTWALLNRVHGLIALVTQNKICIG